MFDFNSADVDNSMLEWFSNSIDRGDLEIISMHMPVMQSDVSISNWSDSDRWSERTFASCSGILVFLIYCKSYKPI